MSKDPHTKRIPRGFRRVLRLESLEARHLLSNSSFGPLSDEIPGANPWHNSVLAPDVDGRDGVTPLDVLLVIQRLNAVGNGPVPAEASGPPYYDVSGDGLVPPVDALLVIRSLLDVRKKWTFLVYADADNDLERDLLEEFRLMSAVPDYSDFNILVQLDRARETTQGYDDWEITHRFVMSHGIAPLEANAVADWEDGGGGGREVDMTDSVSLRDFINWGSARFPAENMVLIVADHGYGWRGLCVDDTSGSARMTIRDLSSALNAAAEKMDLLFFDACYMQSIEVAYELRNSGAKFLVGSQAPSSPVMPFDKIFAELARNPDQSLLDFAKNINDRYAEKYQAGDYFTQSTVELAKIAAVVDSHAALVQAIVSNAGFAAQQAQAARVSARIADAVVYNRTGGAAAGYAGLGIYFPEPLPIPPTLTLASPGELDFYIKWTVAFSTESGWKRFLDVYTSPGGPPPFPIDRRIVEARQALDGTVGDELAVVDLRQFCDLVWQSR